MGWQGTLESEHMSSRWTDCYSGAALLPMVSCRVATPDPITVRPLPASSPSLPHKTDSFDFSFCEVISVIIAFALWKNILVVVYIRESCCWLFETV